MFLRGISHEVHEDIKDNESIMKMHDDAEKFDPRTEEVFKVLQVISACAMSFAHGKLCFQQTAVQLHCRV